MIDPVDYYAKQLHKAISGIGTDESVIIEILGIHNNEEIIAICEAYERRECNSPIQKVQIFKTNCLLQYTKNP